MKHVRIMAYLTRAKAVAKPRYFVASAYPAKANRLANKNVPDSALEKVYHICIERGLVVLSITTKAALPGKLTIELSTYKGFWSWRVYRKRDHQRQIATTRGRDMLCLPKR